MNRWRAWGVVLIIPIVMAACAGGGDDGEGLPQDTGSPVASDDGPLDVDHDGDGVTENQGDCNDADGEVHPGAEEICEDGIDQDCDGLDLSCSAGDPGGDADGDGYAVSDGDCDDGRADVHPGAAEVCEDGIDQDCDGEDPACGSADEGIATFARDYEMSMDGEDIDLFMGRISRHSLHNGMDYDCQYELRAWYFSRFDYSDTRYRVDQVTYDTVNGLALATIQRTLSYTVRTADGDQTTQDLAGEVVLLLEDGKWRFYGNQNGYTRPGVAEMVTCAFIDESGQPVGVTNRFTSRDSAINVFLRLDNVGNGDVFNLKLFRPDGTVYSENPYAVQWGDYPACGRSALQWSQNYVIFEIDQVPIPGLGFGPDAEGTWRVELSQNGAGFLGETFFEFDYIPLSGT